MLRTNTQQQFKRNIKSFHKNHQSIQKLTQPVQNPTIKQLQINIIQNTYSLSEQKNHLKTANEYVLKEQIQLLKKYLQYLKQENQTLKTQLAYPTQVEAHTQTYQITHQIAVMTVLDQSDIRQLENTLEMSTQHTNNLIKELQCLYANNQQLNTQIQVLAQKLQIVSNQLYKRNQQIQLAEFQLEQLRKGFLSIKKPVLESQTNTTINLEQLESILIQNEDLKQKNQQIWKQKLNLERLYRQMSENIDDSEIQSINNDYIQKVKCYMRKKIDNNIKPLKQEIQLLKQLFEKQNKIYKDKQIALHKLLTDAHQTIQDLMNQLRTSKKQAKDQYINNLIKQRSLIGVKAIYDITLK